MTPDSRSTRGIDSGCIFDDILYSQHIIYNTRTCYLTTGNGTIWAHSWRYGTSALDPPTPTILIPGRAPKTAAQVRWEKECVQWADELEKWLERRRKLAYAAARAPWPRPASLCPRRTAAAVTASPWQWRSSLSAWRHRTRPPTRRPERIAQAYGGER